MVERETENLYMVVRFYPGAMIFFNRKFVTFRLNFYRRLIPTIYNYRRWAEQLNQSNVLHKFMDFNSQDTRVMSCMGYLLNTVLANKAKLSQIEVKNIIYFLRKKKRLKVKQAIIKLNITFRKKNIFFNLTTPNGNSTYITTTRRQGYKGRRLVEYSSIYSTSRLVRNIIKRYKKKKLAIFYNGWHRFRFAVVKALEASEGYPLKIKYLRYLVRIPHNGCRLIKKTARKYVSKWYRRTREFKDVGLLIKKS
jgi:ribosomal protein S11